MTKRILSLVLILLIILACNLPFGKKNFSPDKISTKVSLARTATSISSTQIPTEIAPPKTPTPEVTSEVSPSITNSPEPTLTSTPADFAAQLGAPIYSNSLDSGKAFGIDSTGYDDGYTRITLSDGAMVMSSYAANGWRSWRLSDRGMSNYYLEGTFTTQTCAGRDQYGLVFRSPDYATGEGFYFGVTCEGKYALLLSDGTHIQALIDWTPSDKIKVGSNQTNRLGVLVEGSGISLFINGEKVNETSNSTYLDATKVGVYFLALNTPGFTVELDQFNMWKR
jgi:hypothetical protein